MSTVWEMRYRVLWQRLEQLTKGLGGARPPAALADHTVRLLAFAVTLLEQHRVTKRGRCRFCSRSRRSWRFWHQTRLNTNSAFCRPGEYSMRNLSVACRLIPHFSGKKNSISPDVTVKPQAPRGVTRYPDAPGRSPAGSPQRHRCAGRSPAPVEAGP